MQSNHLPQASSSRSHQDNSTANSKEPSYLSTLNLAPMGSIESGKTLFSSLLAPMSITEFMKNYWQQIPVMLHGQRSGFFDDCISIETIGKILNENHFEYGKDVEVDFYGEYQTIPLIGCARPPSIWNYHNANRCGIRILHLENYMPPIHEMNETLQEFFQCRITSNVYFSSNSSSGYINSSDDREKFIIQVEGKNSCSVYGDPNDKPVLVGNLTVGDMLYIPHGFSLKTTSMGDRFLQLTLTLDGNPTFGKLLEVLLPIALEDAIKNNVNLRMGLPVDIWRKMGAVNSDYNYDERYPAIKQIKHRLETVKIYAKYHTNIDKAVDAMAVKYQNECLPPKLSAAEELRTVYGTKLTFDENGCPKCINITLDTNIRLIRENVIRMVKQGSECSLYYSSENLKELQPRNELNKNCFELSNNSEEAVQILINKFPLFVTPRDLQMQNDDENLYLAQELWRRGILITDKPLV